ncbi:MAG: DNA-3-methyladenine glycosylase [Bdellovibrionota bacterium]
MPLPAKFYRRDTALVARELIGKRLVRVWRGKRLSGIITETEAYLGATDRAAHTFGGRATPRVKSMYLEGGHAYVYQIYGMHFCINAVTREAGEGQAVLIRALAMEGGVRANGPGLLCKALRIDRKLDGFSLQGPTIFIERAVRVKKEEIGASARIGVDYAGEAAEWPLRFFWKGHHSLSRKEKRA